MTPNVRACAPARNKNQSRTALAGFDNPQRYAFANIHLLLPYSGSGIRADDGGVRGNPCDQQENWSRKQAIHHSIVSPNRHKAPTARASPAMLNSARRHSISPRRGRLVDWSDPRPGIERLFHAGRICRRCACDASYESVVNPGSISVTTTDNPLVIDSV